MLIYIELGQVCLTQQLAASNFLTSEAVKVRIFGFLSLPERESRHKIPSRTTGVKDTSEGTKIQGEHRNIISLFQ